MTDVGPPEIGDRPCPGCGGPLAVIVEDGLPIQALCAYCGVEWDVDPEAFRTTGRFAMLPRHRIIDVPTGDWL